MGNTRSKRIVAVWQSLPSLLEKINFKQKKSARTTLVASALSCKILQDL